MSRRTQQVLVLWTGLAAIVAGITIHQAGMGWVAFLGVLLIAGTRLV